MKITKPTRIQARVIPILASPARPSAIIASETGSGKTLSYLLPMVRTIDFEGQPPRCAEAVNPRGVILAPTRELCEQILDVAKAVSHHVRYRSAAFLQMKSYTRLEERNNYDLVIATPNTFMELVKEKKLLSARSIQTLVLDECDVLLSKKCGFEPHVTELVDGFMSKNVAGAVPQLVLVGATSLHNPSHGALHLPRGRTSSPPPPPRGVESLRWFRARRPQGRVLRESASSTVSGELASAGNSADAAKLPKSLRIVVESVDDREGFDKHPALGRALSRLRLAHHSKVLVFCNSVDSCRSTGRYLEELLLSSPSRPEIISLHGGILPHQRKREWEAFRAGAGTSAPGGKILVCTDLASRGLDFPEVSDVIIFDLPSNRADFLHRVGRTARGGRPGQAVVVIGRGERERAKEIAPEVLGCC